jgi:hypothetical protein
MACDASTLTPPTPRLQPSTVHAEQDRPPLDGYDRLGARDAMRALKDLPRALLERLYSYEDLHLRRSSVLRAIKRAIDRQPQ